MQISESAVRPSLQFFSLSEKCRMMNICRCQDKGGTFSSVILSHWVLHLHCLVSSPYSAPDSNPPSVAQKFDSQPVYLTSRLFLDLILSWGVRNRKSRIRADIWCCSHRGLLIIYLLLSCSRQVRSRRVLRDKRERQCAWKLPPTREQCVFQVCS